MITFKDFSCETLIEYETEKAKFFNMVPVPVSLNNVKQAWWQDNLLMVLHEGEWSQPILATDEEYKALVEFNR